MKQTLAQLGIIIVICGIIALADLICFWQTGHYLFGDKYAHGDWK